MGIPYLAFAHMAALGRAGKGEYQSVSRNADSDRGFGNRLEVGAMISFHQIVMFLAPALVGATAAVIAFQIIDRLNLFYQDKSKERSGITKQAAA